MGTARQVYDEMWIRLEETRWEPLMELFTEDAEVIFQDGRFSGAERLRAYLEAVMVALPDLTHEVVEAIEREDGTPLAGWWSRAAPMRLQARNFPESTSRAAKRSSLPWT